MNAADRPPTVSRRRLSALTAGAVLLAGVIITVAVLPAELGRDPTGLGRATGLDRLWAPPERAAEARAAARAGVQDRPFRTDVIEIPLTGMTTGPEGYSLEYKVRMARDAALVFAWEAVGARDASDLEFDFHGHTVSADPKAAMTVASYEKGTGTRRSGWLIAPFDGIHGWYLQSWAEQPVVVRLRLSGFYELVPPGAAGNDAGIVANVAAAKARPDLQLRSRTQAGRPD